ncbi:MAG: hypothetical protein ABW110_09015, partial [Steroidobacteraceae bacterium]
MHELMQLLWQNNTAAGKAIILLIIVLGGIASLCALTHYARYRGTERQWLESVRDRLKRAQA